MARRVSPFRIPRRHLSVLDSRHIGRRLTCGTFVHRGVAGPKTQDGDFVTLVSCMDDLGVVPKTAVSSRSGRAPQDDLGRGAQDGGGRRPALRC